MRDADVHAEFLDEMAEAPDTERASRECPECSGTADGCDGDGSCAGDDYSGILHDRYDSGME